MYEWNMLILDLATELSIIFSLRSRFPQLFVIYVILTRDIPIYKSEGTNIIFPLSSKLVSTLKSDVDINEPLASCGVSLKCSFIDKVTLPFPWHKNQK